jgi:hypothetical protein
VRWCSCRGWPFPDLTPDEQRQFDALVENEKRRLKPAAEKIAAASDAELAEKIAKRTKTPVERVLKQVQKRRRGFLMAEIELHFDDDNIGVRTVRGVLLDPDRFVGETLADPLEGLDYGRCKAKVFIGRLGDIVVHSFAHGDATYVLAPDAATLKQLIEAAGRDGAVAAFAKYIPIALVELDEAERLRQLTVQLSGVGPRVVNAAVKAEKERRAEKENEFRAKASRTQTDGRPRLEAPSRDDPLGRFAANLDEILARNEDPEPFMRDLNGALVRIEERPHTGGPEARHGGNVLPTPDLIVRPFDDIQVSMRIGRSICIFKTLKGGAEKEVALDINFVRALMRLERSQLPTVCGVSDVPIVNVSGRGNTTLIAPSGLDRERKTFFRIPPEILSDLPDPDQCTLEAAAEAFDYLKQSWLGDVATDVRGKAIIIAMTLTILQRPLLHARPGFVMRGGQQAVGKTTAAQMAYAAACGRITSVAAWSGVEEERRKALLAHFREGSPLVLFDNIPRGTTIESPAVEAVLTTGRFQDRILKESAIVSVPAMTVFCWTGNALSLAGDMATRLLVAEFTADRVDPENRTFSHAHPIGWTLAHRGKILRALYTLLLMPRPTSRLQTRFSEWMRQVGLPIEAASGVDFSAMFAANAHSDEGVHPTVTLFGLLLCEFDWNTFLSVDLARFLDPNYGFVGPPRYSTSDEELKQRVAQKERAAKFRGALEGASGKQLPPGPLNPQQVGKRLQVVQGRAVRIEGVGVIRLAKLEDHNENRWFLERVGET